MFANTSKTSDKPASDRGNGIGSSGLPSLDQPKSMVTPPGSISVIGRDLTLIGEKITIVSQNKLRVDGDVRGNVHGKEVTITDGGSVEGMVCAEKIQVHGAVRGSIRAVSVVLHATSKVDGDVMHHSLAISEGAQFDGRVRRSGDTKELMPVLDPEVIAASEYKNAMSSSD